MGLELSKINPFNQAAAAQGAQKVPFQAAQQPVDAIGAVNKGSNPFTKENSKEQYGVGLVNSDLANMSYKLPNGKMSTCNTLGYA